ncbi:MAG: hypothetical protein LUC93_11230 [Planctomycetaceae bacterium]|nr:hypothetical protein [Planctomycetaceae bacterium]
MRRHRFCLMLLFALVTASLATAGQGLVSTKKNVSAYMEFNGYHLTPIGKMEIPGDQSAAQLFEVTRPGMGPITLGRLFTSCTCIQATAEKRKFARGETVTIMLRNVRPTTGQTYPFYVQVTSPIRATLRYDTWVISDQFVVAPPVVVPEAEAVEAVTLAESVAEEEVEEAPATDGEVVATAITDALEAVESEAPESAAPAEDDSADVSEGTEATEAAIESAAQEDSDEPDAEAVELEMTEAEPESVETAETVEDDDSTVE